MPPFALLLVLAAPQVDVPLQWQPAAAGAPAVSLAFEKTGPSLWTAREPGGQTVTLTAAEGGGYWAGAGMSPPQLLEAGGFVQLQLARGSQTLPYTLTYRRRPNGGEDFLWRAAYQRAAADIALLDANADGVFDRRDTLVVGGRPISLRLPFEFSGAEWRVEHIRADGVGLTLARLDYDYLPTGRLALPPLHDRAGRVARRPPGRPLLIEFWATWCQPCLDGFDRVKTLLAVSSGRLPWVAFNVDDEDRLPLAESVIEGHPLPWTVLARGLGDSDPLWRALDRVAGRGLTLPLYVVVDQNGVLLYAGDGGPGLAALRRRLDDLVRP